MKLNYRSIVDWLAAVRTGHWRGVVIVVAILLLGFGSGLVGALFTRGVILPYIVNTAEVAELNNTFYTLLAKYNFLNRDDQSGPLEIVIRRGGGQSVVAQPIQVAAGTVLDQLSSGTATFFKAVSNQTDPLAAAYLPAEQLGRGFAVTNDGWLLTTAAVVPAKTGIVAVVGGVAYPIEQVIADPLSAWVLVKISATNIPVMSFDRTTQPAAGEAVYGLLGGTTIYTSLITDATAHAVAERRDLVRSSEKFSTVYHVLTPLVGATPGDPLVNAQGKVIGVVTDDDGGVTVLPLRQISRQIEQMLRDGKTARVRLGINYLLLDELWESTAVADDNYGGLQRGALIYQNSRLGITGVAAASPAATGGLKVGDVITKIDGAEVSRANDVAELIQGYVSENAITLTVWRAGETIDLPVTLAPLKK